MLKVGTSASIVTIRTFKINETVILFVDLHAMLKIFNLIFDTKTVYEL